MRLTMFLLLLSNFCLAQVKVVGKWKTIDDNTSKEKSVVEITERSGKIYGKVIKIYTDPGKDPDPVCNKCEASDTRHNKKIIGMEIIKDLAKDGEEYGEGTILDPENGKVYRCKIWVEGGSLMVRGYWGPFFRTQTWLKVP